MNSTVFRMHVLSSYLLYKKMVFKIYLKQNSTFFFLERAPARALRVSRAEPLIQGPKGPREPRGPRGKFSSRFNCTSILIC